MMKRLSLATVLLGSIIILDSSFARPPEVIPPICQQVGQCPNLPRGLQGPRGPAGPRGPQGLQGTIGPAGPADHIYFVTKKEFFLCPQQLVERVERVGNQTSLSDADKEFLHYYSGNSQDLYQSDVCYLEQGRTSSLLFCQDNDIPQETLMESINPRSPIPDNRNITRNNAYAYFNYWRAIENAYLISGIAKKQVELYRYSINPIPQGNWVRKEILRVMTCKKMESAFTQPTPPATP